jgi:hypothetical protein
VGLGFVSDMKILPPVSVSIPLNSLTNRFDDWTQRWCPIL